MTDSIASQRVHIIGCVSTDISKDGKTAMLVFNVAEADGSDGGNKIAITCAVENLAVIRLIFHEAMARVPPSPPQAEKQMLALRTVGLNGMEEVGVAASHGAPLPIIIRMSPDRPEELAFGMSVETALRLPHVINDIVDKLRRSTN